MDKFKEAEEARERIYILREEASRKALTQIIGCGPKVPQPISESKKSKKTNTAH